MECSCCGQDRDPATIAAMQCHEEVRVCRACIGWLREQAGALDVTPVLPVLDMADSVAFYEAIGFDVTVYGDGGYAFVNYNEESVFDLGLEGAAAGAGCYIVVPEVDDWHARLAGLRYPVTPVQDEPYGMREFALTDPSGNRIRFGHSTA